MRKKNNDTKIRIVIYVIFAAVLLTLLSFKTIYNKINLAKAEDCMRQRDYICAFKSYRNAFRTGIDNKEYVENYFNVLKKMEKITLVQQELIMLYTNYPESSVTSEINDIFTGMQNQIKLKYPVNYIDNVVSGTNVVHWNITNKPITVYIDKSVTVPEFYYNEVKKSLEDYTNATDKLLTFEFVNSENDANILILFTDTIKMEKCPENQTCHKILGLTNNTVVGGVLKKSTVRLRLKDLDNTDFTPNKIHNLAKHEIGHALGITGHSYHSEDIMYPVSNDSKFDRNEYIIKISRKPFSQRDIATLKLLYAIVPDITNIPYNIQKYPEMYYPIAVLGTKKQIGEKSLNESLQYFDTIQTNFISRMTLAEGYFSNRDYAKSKETFLSALSIATTNEEKAAVLNNLAVIEYQTKNFEKSVEYADMANVYDVKHSSDEIKSYALIELGRKNEAEKLLKDLTVRHPDNVTFSALLFDIYLKNLHLIKAFEELKRIKSVNPQASEDEMYKNYGFLFIFV